MDQPRYLIPADEIAEATEESRHPLNPASLMRGTHLSSMTGLTRIGVSVVTVPAGHQSCLYHSHDSEEEWVYILSGRGRARIQGEEHEVGPGDFMGFPTPGVAHHLSNPFQEELRFLVGGENHANEIADFPDVGRRMVRRGDRYEIYASEDAMSWEQAAED